MATKSHAASRNQSPISCEHSHCRFGPSSSDEGCHSHNHVTSVTCEGITSWPFKTVSDITFVGLALLLIKGLEIVQVATFLYSHL